MKKKSIHYVDNKKFYDEIVIYRKKYLESKESGAEPPPIPDYIGSCILKIAERLSRHPWFVNYSFKEEMIGDGIENSFTYFNNFDPEKTSNPFAYFTQIIYFAFRRRILKEEKNRYTIYKSFQETVHNSGSELFVDSDGNHLISAPIYDNINEFMERFEKKEREQKAKRKAKSIESKGGTPV